MGLGKAQQSKMAEVSRASETSNDRAQTEERNERTYLRTRVLYSTTVVLQFNQQLDMSIHPKCPPEQLATRHVARIIPK